MLVVAHRGFSARFPENTALAFERAIAAGADFIETDVRLTRDGHAVCSHDSDLKRIAGVRKSISEHTLAELRAVPLPHDQALLALHEALVIARGKVRVLLDIKVESDAMCAALIESMSATGMIADVVCGVRSTAFLDTLRALGSAVEILAMPARPELLNDFLGCGVRATRLWEEDVNPHNVNRIHCAGVQLWVTAGLRSSGEPAGHVTGERLQRLCAHRAGAVLVNDVDLAVRVRRRTTMQTE